METNDTNGQGRDNGQDKDKLASQYDLLAGKFSELYLAGKERGRESMSVALEKAHEYLATVGEFSAEQGRKLSHYLGRDLDQLMSDAQRLGKDARERFHPARVGAGAVSSLAAALELGGNALRTLGEKTKESLIYKTGEMTSAGTLTCQQCGQTLHLKSTGHVPPCPKCPGTVFTKGY